MTESSVATLINLNRNLAATTPAFLSETLLLNINSGPLQFGESTAKTIKEPNQFCHEDFQFIATTGDDVLVNDTFQSVCTSSFSMLIALTEETDTNKNDINRTCDTTTNNITTANRRPYLLKRVLSGYGCYDSCLLSHILRPWRTNIIPFVDLTTRTTTTCNDNIINNRTTNNNMTNNNEEELSYTIIRQSAGRPDAVLDYYFSSSYREEEEDYFEPPMLQSGDHILIKDKITQNVITEHTLRKDKGFRWLILLGSTSTMHNNNGSGASSLMLLETATAGDELKIPPFLWIVVAIACLVVTCIGICICICKRRRRRGRSPHGSQQDEGLYNSNNIEVEANAIPTKPFKDSTEEEETLY